MSELAGQARSLRPALSPPARGFVQRSAGGLRPRACPTISLVLLAAIGLCRGAVTDTIYHRLYPPPAPVQVHPVEGLDAHISDGKLHLRLKDFVELVLLNSTDIHLARLDELTAADAIVNSRAILDPFLQLGWNFDRSVSPGYSQIQGAQSVNSLVENSNILYQQFLPTGQQLQFGFNAIR